MRQKDASLDDIKHDSAREAIQEWFDGAEGQVLHIWSEDTSGYPTYRVVIATKRSIYFARFFPELNYTAEREEDMITDNWNVSIDREAKYPQGFTFDEIDGNIPDPEREAETV